MEEQYTNIDVEEDTNQKELIEQDLDSQPNADQLDEFIFKLEYPEVIPSYKIYRDWLVSEYSNNKLMAEYYKLGLDFKGKGYDEFIYQSFNTPETLDKYNNEYLPNYQKQLREWYLSNPKNKLFKIRDTENFDTEAAENI